MLKMSTKMLFLLLIFFAFCQVQPSFSENLNGLYEDTYKKLMDFGKRIDDEISDARYSIQTFNSTVFNRANLRLIEVKTEIQNIANNFMSNFNVWILMAEEKNIDPKNCTKDKMQITKIIPDRTYLLITNEFADMSDSLYRKAFDVSQNLTHIPKKVEQLKKDFYACVKTDDECLNAVAKAIDESMMLIGEIKETAANVRYILNDILVNLNDIIFHRKEEFVYQERDLTNAGIICIQRLLHMG